MLNVYLIKPTNLAAKIYKIVAPDADSAWRKFCTQYFGPLKPNPADYDVAYAGPVKSEPS